ncbi:MAG: hypothetical protein QOG53_3673 [Frankiales bacterium]|jgi:hypothetical protein|nr:hypothetical protein [Frankiales bacterium]
MGVLLAFFIGWAIGARGGKEGFDEVVVAANDVLRSEEFAMLKAASRTHGVFALRQLVEWLETPKVSGVEDVLARARRLVQRSDDATEVDL